MIHYSCDRCRRRLEGDELRYVLRIEAQAAMDPSIQEPEDDRDHLQELQEILERIENDESAGVGEEIYQRRRFDLCPDCYRKFAENPLGIGASAFGFSKN